MLWSLSRLCFGRHHVLVVSCHLMNKGSMAGCTTLCSNDAGSHKFQICDQHTCHLLVTNSSAHCGCWAWHINSVVVGCQDKEWILVARRACCCCCQTKNIRPKRMRMLSVVRWCKETKDWAGHNGNKEQQGQQEVACIAANIEVMMKGSFACHTYVRRRKNTWICNEWIALSVIVDWIALCLMTKWWKNAKGVSWRFPM